MPEKLTRGLTIGYASLMILDGVLSFVDLTRLVHRHLSTISTAAIYATSPFMFVAAVVLALLGTLRPRWPLLVATAFQSMVAFGVPLAMLLARLTGLAELDALASPGLWIVINVVQSVVGALCIFGVSRPQDGLTRSVA
jgi:hypothetical protein